jgi:holo-[acyl-carrier protein] synthase
MIYGTGIDIVDISRFDRFLERENQPLLHRLFTAGEREYCAGRKNSAQHYALRFAAKEAFLKALGTGLRGGLSWQDMEVVHDGNGKPEFRFTGIAGKLVAEKGLSRTFLSLSHDGNCAVASVILEV